MGAGATILPEFIPADVAPGERRLFEMFRDDPGASGWTVLHSLDLAEHISQTQGEADFLVLVPDHGIVVLEIKSHSFIKYDERGWWLGNSTKPEARGPFKQASAAMHSIRGYLDARDLGQKIPMISAVAFSETKFSTRSPEWHSWQVLDRQMLHGRTISANILHILGKAISHFRNSGLAWLKPSLAASPLELQRVCAALRPRFEVIANPSAKIKGLEESLYRCTQQQFKALDLSKTNPRLILSGLAGTGKTTLALESARREKAAMPDAAVALFCYNRLLGTKLAAEAATLSKDMRAGTFHQWMIKIADVPPHCVPREKATFWEEELPDRVLETLTAPGVEPGILDVLIVDEAQDLLKRSFLDIFNLILKGGLYNGKWLLVGDFNRQNIYDRDDIGIDRFIKEFAKERCTHFTLDQNCRNTQEISRTLTLVSKLSPAYSSVLREDTRHDPTFLFHKSDDDAVDLCRRAVEDSLSEGFKPKDVLLLSPLAHGSTGERLAARGNWKNRVLPYAFNMDAVGTSTIHAFKGLDSPVVIITDIERLDDRARQDLLYIGMSRALHRLTVISHESVKETLQEIFI